MKSISLLFLFAFFLLQCDFNFNNPVDPDVSLSPPKNLQLNQESEWIRVNWQGTDNYTTGYLIMRKCKDKDWQSILYNEYIKQNTFLDTSIQTNVLYQYRIQGLSDENKSGYSDEGSIQAILSAPYDISTYSESETSLNIIWRDSCNFESGFKIIRESTDQIPLIAGIVGNNQNYFIDEGLDYNINYTYYIVGFTEKNESLESNKHVAKIRLEAPSDVRATPVSDHEIQLSWQDNSLIESGFIIERRAGIVDSWFQLATLGANKETYLDQFVLANNNYAYRVKTFSENYESEYSNQIIGKTVFPAPSNLQINSINTYSAEINWSDDCSYETGYIFKYVAEGEIDTITMELPVNATQFTLDDIYEEKSYLISIQARTEYNISEALSGRILFTDSYVQKNTSTLAGSKVNSIDFSADGSLIAIGREDNTCDIWDIDSWSLEQSFDGNLNDESANVQSISFAHASPWLAVGTLQGSIRIMNGDGWLEVDNLFLNAYPLGACRFSIDDSYLAVAQYKYIYLWNTSDWSFSSTLSDHTVQITDLEFSPNGDWLASGGHDDEIIIWSTDNWMNLGTPTTELDDITDLCFSPNSQYLVSGSTNGVIRLWATSDWSDEEINLESSSISAISFSADGDWLATATEESSEIKFWSTVNWQQVPGITGISQTVTSLKYSPDCTLLVASMENGNVNIWDLNGAWTLAE